MEWNWQNRAEIFNWLWNVGDWIFWVGTLATAMILIFIMSFIPDDVDTSPEWRFWIILIMCATWPLSWLTLFILCSVISLLAAPALLATWIKNRTRSKDT